MYRFRKVNVSSDIEQFNALIASLVSPAKDKERMKRIIQNYNQREDAYLLVVEEDQTNELVGSLLAILVEDYTEDLRPLCYIENVVVKENYQHQGIGRMMFEHIEKWAKEKDVNYMLLVSSNHRNGAHAFYEKIGFTNVKGYKKFF